MILVVEPVNGACSCRGSVLRLVDWLLGPGWLLQGRMLILARRSADPSPNAARGQSA